MSFRVSRIATELETARETYDAGLAALKRPDGRAVYSTEEEQQRRQEITATYRAAEQQARDRVTEIVTQAEQQLAATSVADPLTRLEGSELDRASKLRGFISDDYATLPGELLVARAREALQSGDKALCAVHLRAGRQLVAERPNEGYELRSVLSQLEDVIIDVQARDAAQATIDAAQRLQVRMAGAGYLQRVYGSGASRPPAA